MTYQLRISGLNAMCVAIALYVASFGGHAPPEEPSVQDIAIRVERTLKAAKCLELAATIQQFDLIGEPETLSAGLDPVSYHAWMTPDRLRSDVYNKDGQLILAFSWNRGRVQEYRPTMDRRTLIEYDAPEPYGTDDTVFKAKTDCLVGTAHSSWVASESYWAASFRRKIEAASREADQMIGGRPSFVFRSVRLSESGEPAFEHVLYVDKETYLVVQWVTTVSGNRRVHRFDPIKIHDSVPEGVEWTIQVEPPVDAGDSSKEPVPRIEFEESKP